MAKRGPPRTTAEQKSSGFSSLRFSFFRRGSQPIQTLIRLSAYNAVLDPRNPSDSFSPAFGWARAIADTSLPNTEIFPTSEVCLKEENSPTSDIIFEATRMYDRS